MIFLILKMFVYLVLAAGIGGGAGWLLRNLQVQQSLEKAGRETNDAKSKVPQLESLLRGRDEQIVKLKDERKEQKVAISDLEQQVRESEKALRESQRESQQWQQKANARHADLGNAPSIDAIGAEQDPGRHDSTDADVLIADLSLEIAQLKAELEQQNQPDGVPDEARLLSELDTLRGQLAQMNSAVAEQRQQVVEMERERELQNKSLQVLHQQLELERTRRVANG